jgi:hypothetical protein
VVQAERLHVVKQLADVAQPLLVVLLVQTLLVGRHFEDEVHATCILHLDTSVHGQIKHCSVKPCMHA